MESAYRVRILSAVHYISVVKFHFENGWPFSMRIKVSWAIILSNVFYQNGNKHGSPLLPHIFNQNLILYNLSLSSTLRSFKQTLPLSLYLFLHLVCPLSLKYTKFPRYAHTQSMIFLHPYVESFRFFSPSFSKLSSIDCHIGVYIWNSRWNIFSLFLTKRPHIVIFCTAFGTSWQNIRPLVSDEDLF